MQLQDSLTSHFDTEMTLPESGIQSHASNLALLPNGDVLCTWFSGSEEGKSDISIFYSRLDKGADQWTLPQKVSDNPQRSDQNPMFFQTPKGALWLLFTSQDGGNQDTAIIKRRISEDQGHTWGPETVLFPGKTGLFIRQDVQITPAGQWVLPVFHCVIKDDGKPWDGSYDYSAVFATDDEGQSWTEYKVPDSLGCVHMNIQPLTDGTYVAFYRSRWADNIYRSTSPDALHWSVPEKTELPNNNSSIQFTALADGNLAIAYNAASKADATVRRSSLYSDGLEDKDAVIDTDVPRAFWGAPRAPMRVAISGDGGKSWPYQRDVAIGDGFALTNDSKNKKNREFSYPSIKQAIDGDLLLTFTYFRQKIAYLRFSEDWVKTGKKES
ncbi:exo-alpha-sialidase [Agrilactobacillus yilanensis]|uniref:Exo-alpha-sialidase n=1 Tax=Agrilactobacillus yilanensis TaxID=2485997 RepID=A0ABW4J3E5_9LACO|nr:sialidase family protein [Agrilactobacillus yilanensis]